jgi:Flp pilus assembly protein TadD
VYAGRFEALQNTTQAADPVLRLSDFAEEAAKSRNWPEAVAQIKEAQRLCRDCFHSAGLHRDLGMIYCRQGELEKGQEELSEAVKLNPNDSVAAKTLQMLKRLDVSQ